VLAISARVGSQLPEQQRHWETITTQVGIPQQTVGLGSRPDAKRR
jgi:hypothetical protein